MALPSRGQWTRPGHLSASHLGSYWLEESGVMQKLDGVEGEGGGRGGRIEGGRGRGFMGGGYGVREGERG